MACCKMVEEAKVGITSFGVDSNWVLDVISKWGEDVLVFVEQAFKSGFSKEWILEVLLKFGPAMFKWLIGLFSSNKGIGGQMTEEMIDMSLIETLIAKYLPIFVEKYVPILAKMLSDYIVNHLLKAQGLPVVV